MAEPRYVRRLPYVDRGVINKASRADVDQWTGLYYDVLRLSIAYHATGDERFAEPAARLMRGFFLDSVTGMYPNMEFSKRIPGVDEIGSFEVATLSNRVRWLWDSAVMLRGSPAWTDADESGMQAWSSAFLIWMETDHEALREFASKNNHATAYCLIAAILAKYTGDLEKARHYGRHYADQLLPLQFDADGMQPHEIKRTDNRFYHVYNLKTALDLQAVVDDLGVDYIADLTGPLERLLPYLDGREEWTAWPSVPRPRKLKWEYDLLTLAAVLFERPELNESAHALDSNQPIQDYVWPAPGYW